MTRTRKHRLAGVSLIEALLALVVMSLGMLAVAGVQANLRSNADLSRQRAEALRLAEESLDEWRSFSTLTGAGNTYASIVSDGPNDVTPAGSNTTYLRTRVVTDTGASPPVRTVAVRVEWQDRAGTVPPPSVQLFTAIARIAPEVSGSLSVPPFGASVRQPLGRHHAIPRDAIPQLDGTSAYTPPNQTPGPATVTLYFDNASGYVTRVCQPAPCLATSLRWLPLSGYLRSVPADPALEPNLMDPAAPSTALFSSSRLAVDIPGWTDAGRVPLCFIDPPSTSNAIAYLCVVPVPATNQWTGTLTFYRSVGTTPYKICRYAPFVPTLTAGVYTNVGQPLSQQNFLAIGSTFSCPTPATAAYQTLP